METSLKEATMYDFPLSPVLDQISNGYRWNGYAWVPPDTKVVRYDVAQTLTVAETQQARTNIYAAPFDAMAYNNILINGAMEISQEFGITTVNATNGADKRVIDRWRVWTDGGQVLNFAQQTTINLPNGFPAALQMTVATANASPTATHHASIYQAIQGNRIAHLAWGTVNAQPITIGFWFWAFSAGTYSGAITNAAGTRCYPYSFTASASVWEYKTITIPGETTGTWAKDNSIAAYLYFNYMCSTTYGGTAGAWTTANKIGVSGLTNGVVNTSQAFLITGVVIIPGIQAPSAAQSTLIVRPYYEELILCQGSYQKYTEWILGGNTIGGTPIYGDFAIFPMTIAPAFFVNTFVYSNCSGLTANAAFSNHVRVAMLITSTGYGYATFNAAVDLGI